MSFTIFSRLTKPNAWDSLYFYSKYYKLEYIVNLYTLRILNNQTNQITDNLTINLTENSYLFIIMVDTLYIIDNNYLLYYNIY